MTAAEYGPAAHPGNIFIISGPSAGVGKSTIVRGLVELDSGLWLSVSRTTRAPRPGEVNGREYEFVTPEAFAELKDKGHFLESEGTTQDKQYGTPAEPVAAALAKGMDVVLEIEYKGAYKVREHYPEAVLIFILPPSVAVLESRMKNRGDDHAPSISERLKQAEAEMIRADSYDHRIVNHDGRVIDAIAAVHQIILSKRSARWLMSHPD